LILGAIEKGREQMPRSYYSSLGVSEKNLESSRGLPSMNKNPLVLEKENTETKSPCSTHQVMQVSQTTETCMTIYKSIHYQSVELNFIATVLTKLYNYRII